MIKDPSLTVNSYIDVITPHDEILFSDGRISHVALELSSSYYNYEISDNQCFIPLFDDIITCLEYKVANNITKTYSDNKINKTKNTIYREFKNKQYSKYNQCLSDAKNKMANLFLTKFFEGEKGKYTSRPDLSTIIINEPIHNVKLQINYTEKLKKVILPQLEDSTITLDYMSGEKFTVEQLDVGNSNEIYISTSNQNIDMDNPSQVFPKLGNSSFKSFETYNTLLFREGDNIIETQNTLTLEKPMMINNNANLNLKSKENNVDIRDIKSFENSFGNVRIEAARNITFLIDAEDYASDISKEIKFKSLKLYSPSVNIDASHVHIYNSIFYIDEIRTGSINICAFGKLYIKKLILDPTYDTLDFNWYREAKKMDNVEIYIEDIDFNDSDAILKYRRGMQVFYKNANYKLSGNKSIKQQLIGKTIVANKQKLNSSDTVIDSLTEQFKVLDDKLAGKTFCITGKLENFSNRQQLVNLIAQHGGVVEPSVRRGLSYLITNYPNSGSTKNNEADYYGVAKITEAELLNMIK